MSIINLDLNSYNQNLTVNAENKLLYGEIFTPFSLIEKMFDLIPNHLFYDKKLKYPQEVKFSLQIQKMINILISIKNVERTHIDDSIRAFFLI